MVDEPKHAKLHGRRSRFDGDSRPAAHQNG
jgi:hypothetical protein